jgi:similar to spore coat protein
MSHQDLTFHETMEIHELLNFKTVCMTKSKLTQGVVFDQDLKALLERNVQNSVKATKALQTLLTKTQPQ